MNSNDKSKNTEIFLIFAITWFIHAIIFIFLYTTRSLNIAYTDWMMDGSDLGVEYFGTLFFLRSDWHFPIGLMEDLSFGSQSIVYYDALPGVSIILKLFRNILPDNFQFYGIYSLCVFAFQGSLGACCIYKFIKSKFACITGSFLFSMQMAFLSHIFKQIPLSSHWIVLCTFLITLYYEQMSPKKRAVCIAGILAATMFIQTAFLPMVLCILFFRMLAEIWIKRNKKVFFENIALMIMGIACIAFSAYLLGLFHVSVTLSGGGLGRGAIRFDSFFDANDVVYLGIGVIGLFCAATIIFVIKLLQNRELHINKNDKIYLLCAFIAMVISIFFGLSPVAKWGSKIIYEIPLNDTFYRIWSMVRSSYRLAWSVTYGIVILGIWMLSKIRFKWKSIVVIICALIQILDMTPYLYAQHLQFETDVNYENPLVSNSWKELAEYKNKIIFMNADNRNNSISLIQVMDRSAIYSFADYIYAYDMTMTDFYYARKNSPAMNEARFNIWNDLYQGIADEQAIYLFLEPPVRLMLAGTLNFYWVDGYLIGITNELKETTEATKYHAGNPISIMLPFERTISYAVNVEYDDEGNKVLHPEGRVGGPQISLTPGRYKINIIGEKLDNGIIECVSRANTVIPLENAQIAEKEIIYEIQLEETMTLIEFAIANPTNSDITIKDITIIKCNE